MAAKFVSRWPFLAAVALVCAAVSDVFVEAIANTGVFGPAFFDTNDSSIMPALLAALLLAAGVIGLHVRALLRRRAAGRRDWLGAAAASVAARSAWRDFPAITTMQFAALFVMETFEQFAARGHVLAGLGWLGGPAIVCSLLHIVIGGLCTLVVGGLMHISAGVATLVCTVLECVLCARGPRAAGAVVVRRDAASCSHARPAHVRHISGRAPPFSLQLA